MQVICISKKTLILIAITLVIILATLVFILFDNNITLPVSNAIDNNLLEDKYRDITNLINGKEKVAYLTFDDGPTLNVTPKILDILKEENVKASFFVIGKYVDAYPKITKRIYEEGHFIANHSYNHNSKILYKNDDSFINEIKKTDLAISNAIGVENYSSHIFRFPNGFMSSNNKYEKKRAIKLLPLLDYTYIDWNSLNHDSVKKYSKEQLLNNLKKTIKGKDTLVVLMHDTQFVSDSSIVLKESIQYLKSLNYCFENFYNVINH